MKLSPASNSPPSPWRPWPPAFWQRHGAICLPQQDRDHGGAHRRLAAPTDLSARMLAQALGPVLARRWWWTTRAVATATLPPASSSAEADGYAADAVLCYHVISPHITKQKQWDQGDFQPVANVISAPQIIVVRADLPVKTLPELIAYAKANPGKLNYASSGNGSLQHVTGAMLEQQGGIKMVHVPIRAPAPRCKTCWAARWT